MLKTGINVINFRYFVVAVIRAYIYCSNMETEFEDTVRYRRYSSNMETVPAVIHVLDICFDPSFYNVPRKSCENDISRAGDTGPNNNVIYLYIIVNISISQ